jgi:succinoglycan biosynthesis protein ExoM
MKDQLNHKKAPNPYVRSNSIGFEFINIDICICTFQRNEMLKKLLTAINQCLFNNFLIRVIVVDNDKNGSAKTVVNEYAKLVPFPVVYDIEPIQNISLARNKALSLSRAPLIAIIDDDSIPSEKWLIYLAQTMENFKADIVFGPVIRLFPGTKKKWLKNSPMFETQTRLTGTIVQSGSTNNVMIRSASLKDLSTLFNPSFGTTGGGDVELFFRLFRLGKRFVWCDEAIVYETVLPHRLRLSWLIKRSFRYGQGVKRIFVASYTKKQKQRWIVKCFAKFIVITLSSPVLLIISPPRFLWAVSRISNYSGQLFANIYFHEYRNK